MASLQLKEQNKALIEAACLCEDVERITHHDLKTPLIVIISLPQLIMMDDNVPAEHLGILK